MVHTQEKAGCWPIPSSFPEDVQEHMSQAALWPMGWRLCPGKTWGAGSWLWGSRFFRSPVCERRLLCFLSLPGFGVGVGGSSGGIRTPTSAAMSRAERWEAVM